MRLPSFFAIALATAASLGAAPAQAENLKAESHITAVTVYADRATVTREAEVQIPAGASAVDFDALPATLFPDSLRAQGTASVAVTLGAVDNKLVTGAELAAPRERELYAKLQDLQDKRALAATEGEALDAKKKFLATLGQQAGEVTNQNFVHLDLHADQWNAASAALYSGTSETLKASAILAVTLREMDKQISAAQQELAVLRTGARNSFRVTVPVEAKAATVLKLRLSYQLPSVSWRPIYDARLDTASGKVALTQFGEVRQATGEDWNDVALTLSTAQPARGAEPPPLATAWVNLYDYAQSLMARREFGAIRSDKAAAMELSMVQDSAFQKLAMAPAAVPVEAEFKTATIETGGYVSEYKIPGMVTVTADNTTRKLMIGGLESSSTLLAQLRPAVSVNAYLIARTTLGGEAPLLPGSASLFRDGVFIGSANLALLRPGEVTNLSFGIDDQVVAKRQILADSRGSSGLIAKDTTLERKSVTAIQNLHRFAVKAEVLETLPVSQNEKIKIEVLPDATTSGYVKDADNVTGLAKWLLDLPAGGKNEVKVGWRISWPEGSQISGVP